MIHTDKEVYTERPLQACQLEKGPNGSPGATCEPKLLLRMLHLRRASIDWERWCEQHEKCIISALPNDAPKAPVIFFIFFRPPPLGKYGISEHLWSQRGQWMMDGFNVAPLHTALTYLYKSISLGVSDLAPVLRGSLSLVLSRRQFIWSKIKGLQLNIEADVLVNAGPPFDLGKYRAAFTRDLAVSYVFEL